MSTGTLQQEIAFFNKVYRDIEVKTRGTLDKEVRVLRDKIAAGSPTSSGRYKESWRVNKHRSGTYKGSKPLIANAMIFNPLPKAEALELGVDPGSNHPWAVSVSRGTSKSLVVAPGHAGTRIWSAKAVGGTMLKEFRPSYQQYLARTIADTIIKEFK